MSGQGNQLRQIQIADNEVAKYCADHVSQGQSPDQSESQGEIGRQDGGARNDALQQQGSQQDGHGYATGQSQTEGGQKRSAFFGVIRAFRRDDSFHAASSKQFR